jgi:hypothetical protein
MSNSDVVIARSDATKQSILCPRKHYGLFRSARNDEEDVSHHSHGTTCPSDASISPPKKEGTGNAGATNAPVARLQQKKQAAVTTGTPKHPAFPAQWFDGVYVLSLECRA